MTLSCYAVIQGIVQGITELLPVSSTAHLIIVEKLLSSPADKNFSDFFDVVIQLGSILAFLVYFHRKLLPAEALKPGKERRKMLLLWSKAVLGVVPALVIGGLFGHRIQDALYTIPVIAIALIAGGIVLILAECRKNRKTGVTEAENFSFRQVLLIGLAQCLAMIPGVSRSASTIVGGMLCGASRPAAVEYSFFLAIPTMAAASGYSILKHGIHLPAEQWMAAGIGFFVSFLVSWGVVALFMKYIKTNDFKVFGIYRIVLGILLFILVGKGILQA